MDLITSRHFVEKRKGDGFLFGGRNAAGNSEGLEAMFGLCNWKGCIQVLWNDILFLFLW